MTMTKKELITLLREDAGYQRDELTPNMDTTIKINGIAMHDTRIMKLKFGKDLMYIYCKCNGVSIPVAHVFYNDIHSIGYKYGNDTEIATRLYELREVDFNAHCCKEV